MIKIENYTMISNIVNMKNNTINTRELASTAGATSCITVCTVYGLPVAIDLQKYLLCIRYF